MPSVSVAAHEGLPFMNPLGEAAVERAIATLGLPAGARVVETGCGSAELLIRLLERYPDAEGVGVDADPDVIARAERAATARLAGRRTRLLAVTAEAAAFTPGRFDLVINVASSHAHGGFPGALRTLADLARPGGLVLFGEGFWRRPPSAAFLDALGGATVDELPLGIDALEAGAAAVGLEPVAREVASDEDWAAYEETLARNAEALGTSDGDAYAAQIHRRRALTDGASTLGFGLITLRRVCGHVADTLRRSPD
ncbi:MAG: class I SAM-dependent methyltransferase [Solirubrobacteraceae bacterium]